MASRFYKESVAGDQITGDADDGAGLGSERLGAYPS